MINKILIEEVKYIIKLMVDLNSVFYCEVVRIIINKMKKGGKFILPHFIYFYFVTIVTPVILSFVNWF